MSQPCGFSSAPPPTMPQPTSSTIVQMQPTSSTIVQKDFVPRARVLVDVRFACSDGKICQCGVTVSEWCNAYDWLSRVLCFPALPAACRRCYWASVQARVSKALKTPSFSIHITNLSPEGIGISLSRFSEKKLDVDLKTTRTPMRDRLTYIALPIDDMRARLDCWTVRQCYWEYWECITDQWFLKFDLKRDDYFVEGELAELMVELRSDVIGARKPVEPLATFTRGGIQNIFSTFAFGPFHFKAYKKDGRIRGDFQLRITIWEETSWTSSRRPGKA